MTRPGAWKCEICGYVHQGDAPVDSCPVCGADVSHFTPLELLTAAVTPVATEQWRCTVCDYLWTGPQPPDNCPVCSATANLFEPYAAPDAARGAHTIGRLVILGAGVAGVTAAESARALDPEVVITLISREPELPYYRLNLTRLLAVEIDEEALPLKPAAWFAEQRIDLVRGEVLAIERDRRQVRLQNGSSYPYDRLLLACGAHPFVPPVHGATRDGVMTLRTLGDVRRIVGQLRPGCRCVCIGGGLLGLETAAALQRHGAEVTVLEAFTWLLPRQLPRTGGVLLQDLVEGQGIRVICGVQVKELCGDERVRSVLLDDGRELPCDLVMLAVGVRPNSYLARAAGLRVGSGVIIDDRMQTSDPAVYAAGDIAEHQQVVYGIWPAAYAQGVVAGTNAAGGSAVFTGLPPANRLKVLGIELFSSGRLVAEDGSYRLVEVLEEGNYRAILCRDNRCLGGALLGDTSLAPVLKEAIESGAQLPERPALQKRFAGPGVR
jgi:nitrite reductase (NADH) large subunit